MFVTGLGTAVPPYRYSQRECWAAMQAAQQFPELTDRSRRILEKVLCGMDGISIGILPSNPWMKRSI